MTDHTTAAQAAAQILTYLGFAQAVSMEPGVDRRRDHIQTLIESALLYKLRAPVADERDAARYRVLRIHTAPLRLAESMGIPRKQVKRSDDPAARVDEMCDAALASAPQACPTDVCQAGKADGVLCANDECDRANGVRPASAPVAGEARPTDWQAALRISELPEVDEVLGIFCNDGTQDNAVGLVQAILDAAPKASTVAGQVVAWMHEEDQNRVISAQQKAQAERDGGAYASSLRPYTIALGCLPAPQASVAAPAIGSNLINAACWKFVEAAVYAAVCHVLSAQSAEKPATSATSTASGPRQARVSGLPKTGNHNDGGSVYE